MAGEPQAGITPMTTLFAPTALLPEGWRRDVRVTLEGGRIGAVEAGARPGAGDLRLDGMALLPAPGNLHSHAFQRAMAGMTERRGPGADSFWTWRELMYRFLDVLTPEDVEAIAGLVYVEMLEAGYAAVGEFHYLHHRPGGGAVRGSGGAGAPGGGGGGDGGNRDDVAAGALQLRRGRWGGAGGRAAAVRRGSRRDSCGLGKRPRAGLAADGVLGTAPHSLRATTPDQIAALAVAVPEGPMHIHAAEQVPEVEQVVAWLGARPVEFLLDEVGLDARWCLIHATQMTGDETVRLAASGAVAGLCPITEGKPRGRNIQWSPNTWARAGGWGWGRIPTSGSRWRRSFGAWSTASGWRGGRGT